ncbi:MAG: metal-dependent hydrolase [Cohaesibacter sp.]|jgi:L-ascorbate metabolism protein UlaG (beta-lactamase superfamily)|nr:metal-dependent hydrolase [Cohaesibacter sp.]
MKIIWLGHSAFRLEIADQILLVDPWLEGNPMLGEDQYEAATQGATHILLTHAHFDHAGGVVELAKKLNVPLVGQFDLLSYWAEKEGIEVVAFNKGGTVKLGEIAVTMVNAVHSSSMMGETGPQCTGSECGFMLAAQDHVLYISGDTDVTADMGIFNDLHAPDIGILAAGGHFTMDMERATYAAKKFFNFKTVIPCHYRTFPILEQSAQVMKDGLPGVDVIEPEVMQPITIS